LSELYSDLRALPARPTAIFGASSCGRSVLEALRASDIEPTVFLDNRASGPFEGKPVHPPQEWRLLGVEAIAIGSMYGREMHSQLERLGFDGPVLDLSARHLPRWEHHFSSALIEAHACAIAEARALLSDDSSRAVLDRMLGYRRSLSPNALPPQTRQYWHPEVGLGPNEAVLDCGAFDGADSIAFAEAIAPGGMVHAFEPEPANLARLDHAIARCPLAERVRSWPLAVWNRRETLRFTSGGEHMDQSRIAAAGEVAIQAVPIDELVGGGEIPRVHFIKMDIEGAEREALEGACRTLLSQRPKLAICCYHRPDDLWEIPRLIARLMPGCRLWMAHHSQNLYETVCYAR
jgi:FkbM family methyltransferase